MKQIIDELVYDTEKATFLLSFEKKVLKDEAGFISEVHRIDFYQTASGKYFYRRRTLERSWVALLCEKKEVISDLGKLYRMSRSEAISMCSWHIKDTDKVAKVFNLEEA